MRQDAVVTGLHESFSNLIGMFLSLILPMCLVQVNRIGKRPIRSIAVIFVTICATMACIAFTFPRKNRNNSEASSEGVIILAGNYALSRTISKASCCIME